MLAGGDTRDVAQEEIFGPVVTVIPFADEEDAIGIANDVRYGLMATVWTGDPARGHRVAPRIKSGTVGINMPYTAFPGIPFGGYKQSGFGRELGLETLELYLETKSVLVSTGNRPTTRSGSSASTARRAAPPNRPESRTSAKTPVGTGLRMKSSSTGSCHMPNAAAIAATPTGSATSAAHGRWVQTNAEGAIPAANTTKPRIVRSVH